MHKNRSIVTAVTIKIRIFNVDIVNILLLCFITMMSWENDYRYYILHCHYFFNNHDNHRYQYSKVVTLFVNCVTTHKNNKLSRFKSIRKNDVKRKNKNKRKQVINEAIYLHLKDNKKFINKQKIDLIVIYTRREYERCNKRAIRRKKHTQK